MIFALNFSHNYLEGLWQTAEARRKLFERYAQENGFDPLAATNWYEQSGNNIRAFKVTLKRGLTKNNFNKITRHTGC
jgi:hypothetical protein